MNVNSPLDHIGKRMPYTIPKGCFQHMENNIWLAVKEDALRPKNIPPTTHQSKRWTILAKSTAAIAAIVAVVFVIHAQMRPTPTSSINDIDQAFCQLSKTDQEFIIEVYQNDLFLE